MTAIASHPFRQAIDSRDVGGLSAAIDPEVTFYSPLIDVPIRGRDRVLGLFAVLAGVFEDFEYTDELVGEGTLALAFRFRVDGHPIEGVDHLQLGEDGRVRSIAVSMRPLASVQALAIRMADPLAELLAGDAAVEADAAGQAARRVRITSWTDPRASAEQGARMSGLAYLRALRDGDLPEPPIGALIGFHLDEVEDGRVSFVGEPAEAHYNPIGMVHAGFAATLLDSAMGCAVHSTLPAGAGYATLEFKVNLLRALTAETGLVKCIGQVVHRGTSVATAEARLVSEETGNLLASATTTCLLRETGQGP